MQQIKVSEKEFFTAVYDGVVKPACDSLFNEMEKLVESNNYLLIKDCKYALVNIPDHPLGFLSLKVYDSERKESWNKINPFNFYACNSDSKPFSSIFNEIKISFGYYSYFTVFFLPLVSDIIKLSKDVKCSDIGELNNNLRWAFKNCNSSKDFRNDSSSYVYVLFKNDSFYFSTSSDFSKNCIITFVPFDKDFQKKQLFSFLIKNRLVLEKLSEKNADVLSALGNICAVKPGIINESFDDGILCKKSFIEYFMENNLSKEDCIGSFLYQLKAVAEKKEITASSDKELAEKLLCCEKVRADIEPYEAKILTDPNRGHWDLYSEKELDENSYKITFNNYYARNPAHDVNEDGAIAIDFGTKSTVVVYQKESQNSLPMGIGYVKAKDATNVKRYENPTVMQFVNLENFLSAYNASSGRPSTKWEDLPISHTAMERFKETGSEDYYSFLYQLKQWAGLRNKKYRIRTKNGESRDLPDFLSLKENDFNPIELYAYYIGLYINNMRNGIYLDYSLSFPVTYEKEIRNKITESFEKGLKKSLPESILDNPEIMKNFKIVNTFSEPQAYAACALREYGFEPDEKTQFMYGIFDFGGGTTDFDFGIWKLPDQKSNKYNYALENFPNPNGDRYLGGENLLEMLAFEIFKDNKDIMLEGNYCFSLPPGMNEFMGSDVLISESQEAEKNIHNLMEVLRPYWEQSEGWYSQDTNVEQSADENDSEEKEVLKVTLFDKEGKDKPNVELFVTKKRIYDFLEMKIRGGIDQFFDALTQVFYNNRVAEGNINKVNIFLAGNSCKSPIVKKLFLEKINSEAAQISEKFDKPMNANDLFELFPPLGTPEAEEKQKERNVCNNRPMEERPSGKTGVAFGLLKFRDDGIKIVNKVFADSEIPFRFYIGYNKKDILTLFEDDTKIVSAKGKPDYDVWYKYIEADDDTVYLYYTDLPSAISGTLHINGNPQVKRVKLNIEPDENAFVYIKAISPTQIQYVVSNSVDVEKGMKGTPVTRELKVE